MCSHDLHIGQYMHRPLLILCTRLQLNTIHIILPFFFSDFLNQLESESIGQRVRRNTGTSRQWDETSGTD